MILWIWEWLQNQNNGDDFIKNNNRKQKWNFDLFFLLKEQ